VFLRGANLGKRRFKPAAVAKALCDLDVVNLGAAGTFVVHGKATQAALRRRIQAEIHFDAPMSICTAAVLRAAVKAGSKVDEPTDARRFAAILEAKPSSGPSLPLEEPSGKAWGVRLVARSGPFVIGVRRRVDATGVYPSKVIEDAFGVPASTRDWPPMEKIEALL